MNRAALNTRPLGNGARSFGVFASAATALRALSSVSGYLFAGASSSTRLKIETTQSVFSVTVWARAMTTLALVSSPSYTMFRAIYLTAATSLRVTSAVAGTRMRTLVAALALRVLTTASGFGLINPGQGSTLLKLTLQDKDIVIYGAQAPAERQMVVQQEDRIMVV